MKRAGVILTAIAVAGICIARTRAAENEGAGAAQLTVGDLGGRVAISDANRTAFVDGCFARRTELFTSFMRESSITPDDKRELKNNIDETFPRFCSCLAKGLESGLSKVQFLMAETMIREGKFISYPGSPMPDFAAIRKEAEELGMSSADFEGARQEFRIHAAKSAEACFLVLWGPTLARRFHIPEFRAYSGSPETVK